MPVSERIEAQDKAQQACQLPCFPSSTLIGVKYGHSITVCMGWGVQDDVLFHNLTVRETFEFAAKMRLPASIPPEQRAALVTSIITELGLVKAENTYVGVSRCGHLGSHRAGKERLRACMHAFGVATSASIVCRRGI